MAGAEASWRSLREECVETLWREVSAPILPEVCRGIGLNPTETDANPMSSKRVYVRKLLENKSNDQILHIAHQIVERYESFLLKELINKREEVGETRVSKTTRRNLFQVLDGISISGRIDLIEFLNDLWPLEMFDATGQYIGKPDSFFGLEHEIYQHCVWYDDWPNTELLARLGLLRSSKSLLFRFLEMCVHPRTRSEEEQRLLAKEISSVLRRDGFVLSETGRESGYPVFSVKSSAELGSSPATIDMSSILSSFDEEGVHAVWEKALNRKNSDPEGAITAARTLLETVCKHVLDEQEIEYDPKEDLPKLWKLCADSLNLAPSQHTLEPFKQVLSGCTSVVTGLGTIRNKIGDAHGQGRRPVKPKARHAALVVDLAGAMSTFVVATYNDRTAK